MQSKPRPTIFGRIKANRLRTTFGFVQVVRLSFKLVCEASQCRRVLWLVRSRDAKLGSGFPQLGNVLR